VTTLFADALAPAALAGLWNAGFSDYLVPLELDEAALREHVRAHDIDLAASPVATAGHAPAAFALLGVRGAGAWIGGMATAPPYRRRGLGRCVMAAALEAASQRGCDAVWLEVVDANAAAIALYRELGFAAVRDLDVWSLEPQPAQPPPSRPVDATTAQAFIAAHRGEPEPWQRADATVARLVEGGAPLEALVVERSGAVAGAAVHRTGGGSVGVLQIAALDDAAAADVLLAAAGGRAVHLANTPTGGACARVLAALGARLVARQHEMRLRL
jgi:ribosomal protein S18 acetylase RimI-like enzyme